MSSSRRTWRAACRSLRLGRSVDAIKTFETLRGLSSAGAASFALAGLGDIALYEGRTTDALRYLREGIAADEAREEYDGPGRRNASPWPMPCWPRAMLRPPPEKRNARRPAINTTPTLLTGGLILARIGRGARPTRSLTALASKVELDPQAYARVIRAELALAQRQPRLALDHLREAQKLADSWLGRVLLARTYLDLGMFPEATSEIDAALKRSGEATAVALQDDVPTFRYFPPLHYYKGLAQEGSEKPGRQDQLRNLPVDQGEGRRNRRSRCRRAKAGGLLNEVNATRSPPAFMDSPSP